MLQQLATHRKASFQVQLPYYEGWRRTPVGGPKECRWRILVDANQQGRNISFFQLATFLAINHEVVLALIGEQFDEALADGDEICGFTVSIRQHDNIIRVWNTNASAHSTGLLDRLKAIIPKVEIRSPYYKANQEHTGFSKEFFEKAAKKATD